jgi:hypothetical protein
LSFAQHRSQDYEIIMSTTAPSYMQQALKRELAVFVGPWPDLKRYRNHLSQRAHGRALLRLARLLTFPLRSPRRFIQLLAIVGLLFSVKLVSTNGGLGAAGIFCCVLILLAV